MVVFIRIASGVARLDGLLLAVHRLEFKCFNGQRCFFKLNSFPMLLVVLRDDLPFRDLKGMEVCDWHRMEFD